MDICFLENPLALNWLSEEEKRRASGINVPAMQKPSQDFKSIVVKPAKPLLR